MDKGAVEYKALGLLEALGPARARLAAPARTVLEAAHARAWLGLPKAAEAARALAAEANAQRGHELLWLFRAPPAKRGKPAPTPPGRPELETWLGEMRAHFEGIPPMVELLEIVTAEGERVFAAHIETDRAPFVIYQQGTSSRAKNAGERPTEVLWQPEGGPLRTIRRAELVRLVTPLRDLPEFEVLVGELSFYENVNRKLDPRNMFHWSLDATVYVSPEDQKRWILPFRRTGVVIESMTTPGGKTLPFTSEAMQINLSGDRESTAISETESALLVHGLGQFYIFASGSTTRPVLPLKTPLRLVVGVTPTGCPSAAVFTATLNPARPKEGQAGLWKLG